MISRMPGEWDALSEIAQLTLARQALSRAAGMLAVQAEVLADEFERGNLADRGGADALRLFAAIVRINSEDELPVAGSA
jgi:hypothetical protein